MPVIPGRSLTEPTWAIQTPETVGAMCWGTSTSFMPFESTCSSMGRLGAAGAGAGARAAPGGRRGGRAGGEQQGEAARGREAGVARWKRDHGRSPGWSTRRGRAVPGQAGRESAEGIPEPRPGRKDRPPVAGERAADRAGPAPHLKPRTPAGLVAPRARVGRVGCCYFEEPAAAACVPIRIP